MNDSHVTVETETARAAEILGSRIAADMLAVLADRGVIEPEEIATQAERIWDNYDAGATIGELVSLFAAAVELPAWPIEPVR